MNTRHEYRITANRPEEDYISRPALISPVRKRIVRLQVVVDKKTGKKKTIKHYKNA